MSSHDCLINGSLTLKEDCTEEEIRGAFRDFTEYQSFDDLVNSQEISVEDGELSISINVPLSLGASSDSVQNLVNTLHSLVAGHGYIEVIDFDTGSSDEHRVPIFVGASEQDRKMAQVEYGIDQMAEFVQPLIGDQQFNALADLIREKATTDPMAEVLPGATRSEVREIMMQELVGDCDDPADVPEWAWVEENASFSHVRNGKEDGVWEFVLNLSRTFSAVPQRIAPAIAKASRDGIAYLVLYQG